MSHDELEKNRRYARNWLIHPAFQLPLVIFNLCVIGIILIIFWVTGQDVIRELEPAAQLSGMEVDLYRKILSYHSSHLHLLFGVAAAVSMILSSFVVLYYTHRMAGPIVAMRHYFRKIKEGVEPMPTLHFRDHDFLMDIPPLVNDAIAALVDRLKTRRRDSA
jgi:hypothetical protein